MRLFLNSLLILALCIGTTSCLRNLRSARLALDDVQVAERGHNGTGLYQFDLVPKIRNTGVLRAEAKLAVRCTAAESIEKEVKSEPFHLSLDTGESKNARPVTFTSQSAVAGSRIAYECHLVPNDGATKQMLSAMPFTADFEVRKSEEN